MNKVILITKDLPAYYAAPETKGKHPGILLIHEIWGLTPHIRDVANRLAAVGYVVIAPNLFHEMSFEGKVDQTILADLKDPEKRDEAQKKMRDFLAPTRSPEFARDTMKKLGNAFHQLAKDELASEEAIGVIGFCWGGTYAWNLAAKEPRLKAAIVFYGQPPDPLDKTATIVCPVLAFYGADDKELTAKVPAIKETMQQFEKSFESIVYPNTGHAFFNDTNVATYKKEAAEDAWQKTLAFLEANLVKK